MSAKRSSKEFFRWSLLVENASFVKNVARYEEVSEQLPETFACYVLCWASWLPSGGLKCWWVFFLAVRIVKHATLALLPVDWCYLNCGLNGVQRTWEWDHGSAIAILVDLFHGDNATVPKIRQLVFLGLSQWSYIFYLSPTAHLHEGWSTLYVAYVLPKCKISTGLLAFNTWPTHRSAYDSRQLLKTNNFVSFSLEL